MLGGGPADEVFGWLNGTRDDVVIDIGCGPGLSFERLARLDGFAEYHGFDTDPRALERFRRKNPPEGARLYNSEVTAADLDRIRPQTAIMTGILHHLADGKASALLDMLSKSGSVRRAITLDPVLIEGKTINNILCRLDRGRYVRNRHEYEAMFRKSGLETVRAEILTSGNGLAFYFCSLLTLAGESGGETI